MQATFIKVQDTENEVKVEQKKEAPKRKYIRRIKNKEKNSGQWTNEEKLKYIVFLEFYKRQIDMPENWRTLRIFKNMSKFIVSRTAEQCRTHHQKMQKHFQSCMDIIQSSKRKVEPYYLAAYVRYYHHELMRIHIQEASFTLFINKVDQGIKEQLLTCRQFYESLPDAAVVSDLLVRLVKGQAIPGLNTEKDQLLPQYFAEKNYGSLIKSEFGNNDSSTSQ